MAITRVQSNIANGSSTAPSVDIGIVPAAGDLVVVAIAASNARTITAPAGFTLVPTDGNVVNGAQHSLYYWIATGVAGTDVITGGLDISAVWRIIAVQYNSSTGGTWTLDKSAQATGSGVFTDTGTTATTGAAVEAWVGAISTPNGRTQSAWTNGFAQVQGASATAPALYVAEKIVAATGAAETSSFLDSSSTWEGNIATFYLAVAAASTDSRQWLVDTGHRRRRAPNSDLGRPQAVSAPNPVLIPIRAYFAPVVRTVRSRTHWVLGRAKITGSAPAPSNLPQVGVTKAASTRRHARRIPRSVLRRPAVVAPPSQFQARRSVLTLFPRRWRRIHPRSKLRPPNVIGPPLPPAPAPTCATGPLAYLKFGEVEIANIARTLEYLRNGLGNRRWEIGDCATCAVLYTENSDDCTRTTFVSPSADPAPWYEATEPGASTFLGVALLDISGYDSTITREITSRVGDLGGASFSGQRRKPRVWKFRAALVSSDDVGAEYGLRWLTNSLQASACNTCPPSNLTVRLVCPPADCTDDELGRWVSYEVALTEGPTEVTKWSPGGPQDALYGCRDLVVVEWTMTAGNPLLYKEPQLCLAPEVIGETIDCTDICDFLFGAPGEAHCCTVAPPSRGTLGSIFTLQSVSGMNSVLLGAYTNCPSGTEDNPVLEMEISHVPAGGTVTVDSSLRTISLTAPDENGDLVTSDGQSLLVLDDRHLQWLEIRDCDDITCLCARTAHPCSQGGDTLVSISTQMREG